MLLPIRQLAEQVAVATRMEVTNILRRSLYSTVIRSTRCDCNRVTTRLALTSRRNPQDPNTSAHRQRRHLTAQPSRSIQTTSDSSIQAGTSTNSLASPAAVTSKQQIQTYIDDVQKIIDGYGLGKNQNMQSTHYRAMANRLAKDEAEVNAPNANPESFDDKFSKLKIFVSGILETRFPGKDMQQILSEAGKVSLGLMPVAIPAEASSPPSTLTRSTPRARGFAASFDYATDASFGGTQRSGNSIANIIPPQDRGSSVSRDAGASGWVGNLMTHLDKEKEAQKQGPVIRLSTSIGKTVVISGITDVTRAFQRMEAICGRNRVRVDSRSQLFHIRKGQLKKNLRIVRWRRQFKEGFVAECAKIHRMRRQGW